MEFKDFGEIKEVIKCIDVEDYNGNTVLSLDLSELDIADVEGDTLRLQLNKQ